MDYFSYTIEETDHDTFIVYGHFEYESWSVLAGRTGRQFLKSYDSVEEAREAYPEAEVSGNTKWLYDSDPGPNPPSWFDPTYAGERWDDD